MDSLDLIQGSPEWLHARCGSVGASHVYDAIARTKGNGYTAARSNYMSSLIVERLTGLVTESYVNAAMEWGRAHEAEARAAYSFRTDTEVVEVGLFRHPTIAGTHASPDGLIGDDGLVEFKCPRTVTHVETLLGAPIAPEYVAQIQWQLACTARDWCDFVSYDPRLPEEMRLHVRRVSRDNAKIAAMERDVQAFLAELDAKIAALRAEFAPAAPPNIDHADRNGIPAFLERARASTSAQPGGEASYVDLMSVG